MNSQKTTGRIIGAAIEVHRLLGPGLLESAYEECLAHEFILRDLNFIRQVPVPVVFKAIKLDQGYRLDFVVEGSVVVELKTVDRYAPVHEAQILTYLRFSKNKVGLLINFNEKLLRDGLRRYVL